MLLKPERPARKSNAVEHVRRGERFPNGHSREKRTAKPAPTTAPSADIPRNMPTTWIARTEAVLEKRNQDRVTAAPEDVEAKPCDRLNAHRRSRPTDCRKPSAISSADFGSDGKPEALSGPSDRNHRMSEICEPKIRQRVDRMSAGIGPERRKDGAPPTTGAITSSTRSRPRSAPRWLRSNDRAPA